MSNQPQTIEIQAPRKSLVLSVILTVLFGPLGLIYVRTGLGIVLSLVAIVLGILTGGLIAIIMWPLAIVLGIILPLKKQTFKGTIK